MNIDQLIAFDRVVREGSFSRAAWGLNVAQPTVSQRIRGLEQVVGGALLVRNNRRVTLTQRGANFLPHARQMLDAFQRGLDAAHSDVDVIHGELRLAGLRSLTGGLFAPVLQRFQRQHPSVFCYVEEGNQWQIVEWLHDGKIELAVIAWPNEGTQLSQMVPLLLMHEPFDLMVHQSHPLAQRETVTRADVANLSKPLLLQRLWQTMPSTLTQLAADASEVIDVPTDTVRLMLAQGVGASFVNRVQVRSGLLSAEIIPIPITDFPAPSRTSAVVKLARGAPLSAAARACLAELTRCAQELGIDVSSEAQGTSDTSKG